MAHSVQATTDRISSACAAWRCLQSADFVAALAAPIFGKSPHFVLHHVAASPASSLRRLDKPVAAELSTDAAPNRSFAVDNLGSPSQWWLGLVVPKRHARRSVTRSLLKRQMRAHAEGNRHRLPPGQWVIRLRAPFDPHRYPSAASGKLRHAARQELAQVFASAVSA